MQILVISRVTLNSTVCESQTSHSARPVGFACDEVEWKTCLLSLKICIIHFASLQKKQKGEEKLYEA